MTKSDTQPQHRWRAQPIRRAMMRCVRAAKTMVGRIRNLTSSRHQRSEETNRQRAQFDAALAAVSSDRSCKYPRALVDASWDNPNYWYRYALLRAGLGLNGAAETAVLGLNSRIAASNTLSRLGVRQMIDFEDRFGDAAALARQAETLLCQCDAPGDILKWQLPCAFPASVVYDGILKRQRSARVDFGDPWLADHVAEALGSIAAAESILDEVKPDLVILSHSIEFRYGAIAWCALQRGIPVVVAFGNYGVPRYCRLEKPEDFFQTVDCPGRSEIEQLDPALRQILADKGRAYLTRRLSGLTNDLGGQYAFARSERGLDKAAICKTFGWDTRKPIVAVYASNWFDYPHAFGMTSFADFLDWLELTLSAARSNTNVNWLFRAHPCDRWYGGVTLSDLMSDNASEHVRLCPTDWNGADVQLAVGGLVTVHGTAGIEYAAASKPVLLADRGWYHDVGFAYHAAGRKQYMSELGTGKWMELDAAPELAAVFAGVYFCPQIEASGFIMGDDSEQSRLLPGLIEALTSQSGILESNIRDVSDWWASGARHFNTWRAIGASHPASTVNRMEMRA